MGNINNIWYLKDGGGDWASTKCALDDCYSIPYDNELDGAFFLQADIPEGYWANEVWLADTEGNRVQELLAITEWKVITGEGVNRLIFRVPPYSYACQGVPYEEETCVADLVWEGLPPYHQGLISNYVNGLHNTTIYFLYGGVYYDIDGTLPPGFVKIGPTQFRIPCDLEAGDITWQAYSDVGNGNASWPYTGQIGTGYVTVYTPLNCFHFEIPLHPAEEGVDEATLLSEPFHCPGCEPTLKISSDYCLSKTDITGTFIFDTEGFGETQYGTLTEARNDLRIQAVLKQLPSKVSANRNMRCNNFKSKLQQRYRLQGAMPTDFPDYMVNMIESIFSGKRLFIEGVEYVPDSETIFTERNVAGRSMKRLDAELVKCERGLVFDCACVVEPPNCNENPIAYSGVMFIVPAPHLGYGCDRSIWYAGMDPLLISG
jgi:hypothetical protein